jgi:WD40 repeat protein
MNKKQRTVIFCFLTGWLWIMSMIVFGCAPTQPPVPTPTPSPTPVPARPMEIENVSQVVQLAELSGHTGAVYSITWSPDGAYLASGSSDSTIRIWDSKTGQSLRTLDSKLDSVWGAAWSPTDNMLASSISDGTVVIWNPTTGEKIATLPAEPTGYDMV